MLLVQKWPFLPIFFLGNIGQENVFYDILEQKNTFLGCKNKKFKKSKNWHFSMELLQKWQFFTIFFRQYSIGKCLIRYSWAKKHLSRKFKKSKKCHFWEFFNVFFYSLDRCFFVLKYRKRHFPGLYCLKKKVGKMAIFGPKLWVNPSRKKVNV